jgi:hypothetical protein
MTTSLCEVSGQRWNQVRGQDLENLTASLEDDPSLFEPEQLRERLELLDELEIRFGDFSEEGFVEDEDGRIRQRARAIRFRTEAANADV